MAGGDSMCTQGCPSRRGLTRRDVADQLARGHIEPGLHPRSQLILEVQGRLNLVDRKSADEMRSIETQLRALRDRLGVVDEMRRELRRVLHRLTVYNSTGPNHDDQRTTSPQPESEP